MLYPHYGLTDYELAQRIEDMYGNEYRITAIESGQYVGAVAHLIRTDGTPGTCRVWFEDFGKFDPEQCPVSEIYPIHF